MYFEFLNLGVGKKKQKQTQDNSFQAGPAIEIFWWNSSSCSVPSRSIWTHYISLHSESILIMYCLIVNIIIAILYQELIIFHCESQRLQPSVALMNKIKICMFL